MRLGDLSAILLSADEPAADAHWRALAAAFPKAIRVHGLQASWRTIRRAAALADSDRFLVVRGDTRIDPALAEHVVDDQLIEAPATLVWPTRNVVNGLCYASGGLRCCWRPALLEADAAGAPPEIALPRSFGTSHPNGTPRQAFGAGFREAVAHGLVGGRAPGRQLGSRLPPAGLKRLLVWATIGADQDNGLWCLYGARLGCKMAQLDQFDPALLVRPEWLEQLFDGRIAPDFAGQENRCPHSGYGWDRARLESAVRELGDLLRGELALEIVELDVRQSRFLRAVWSRDFDASAFDRLGNLYRAGSILPGDPGKAARTYALGAMLGNGNAADNLARLQLKGEGVPKDVGRRWPCWRRRPAWAARTPPTISQWPIKTAPRPGPGWRRSPSCCGSPAGGASCARMRPWPSCTGRARACRSTRRPRWPTACSRAMPARRSSSLCGESSMARR